MNSLKTFSSVIGLLFLAACADPADKVPAASVSTNANGPTATAAAIPARKTAPAAYAITPENSKIQFTGSKVTGKHDGGFKQFTGEVHAADGAVQHAKVTIDTSSIYTDNERLTGHLKTADFFDVAKYPTAVFETTSIAGQGANATITGNLTMHGITKQITFPARIEVKDEVVTLAAEFSINRTDFQMKYTGKADDLIRAGVVLKLDVKATAKKA